MAKQVTVIDPAGAERQLGHDRLVIGTGAVPVRPRIDGLDLSGVHVLHTMADTFRLHQALTGDAGSAIIVGGGYIGLEMAEAFTTSPLPPIWSWSWSGPARHRPGRGRGRGDRGRGALRVDRRMRTNLPDVLAPGDCVETWHRLLEAPSYLPLGTTAHKQGRIAGETAVGGTAEFAGSLGTQVVKLFELAVARTGLRDAEATTAGLDPVTVGSVEFDHKAYYPGAHQLHLRITGDWQTDGLLGAQLVGDQPAQVAKRIEIGASHQTLP